MKTLADIADRSVPEPNTGCWLWMLSVNDDGYGTTAIGRTGVLAHRAAFQFSAGTLIPDGMNVLHRCDTPSCVNPDHLFLGTHTDNMRDMVRKGRQPITRRWVGGRCTGGHDIENAANLIERRDGKRQCRACKNERRRVANKEPE